MEMTDQEQVPKAAIVAFYRMEDLPPEADWQTRIFHWFFKRKCSNYEHCQFAFVRGMAGPGTFLTTTYTTTKAHPFSDRKIHYRNENWECYEIALDDNQKRFLLEWCREREHTKFNSLGFYWNFFAPCTACTVDKKGTEFFCAEMVATGLKNVLRLRSIDEIRPYICTVDDLHDVIRREPGYFRPYSLTPLTLDNIVFPEAPSHMQQTHTHYTGQSSEPLLKFR